MNRRLRKLAEKVAEKHWRARWRFDHAGLTVVHRDGLRIRFDGL